MDFTYACIAKPPSMEGAIPYGHESYDETDTRGVFGVVCYKDPLPKSDEDICGLRLVDGPDGRYRVTAIDRKTGLRTDCNTYFGRGYDILRRADMEAIRHDRAVKEMSLEWLGFAG